MNPTILRIATRQSALALWQADYVAAALRRAHPGLTVELVGMTTRGDKILDAPLAKVGGKGLFVKELEQALLAGEADIAVHSMKDVPAALPDGLCLPTALARDDPRDAFVARGYAHPADLPVGARVGTSSLRRQCQLAARYPRLDWVTLRGNVATRLAKLDAGAYDAVILAAAGLRRLGLKSRIACYLEPEDCLPAIGQGVIGVECRAADRRTLALLAPLNDADTQLRITAERALNARLQGGCQTPIAGYAVLYEGELWLRGLVGAPDGRQIVKGEIRGPAPTAARLGVALAEELLDRGAAALLQPALGAPPAPTRARPAGGNVDIGSA